MDFAIDLQGEDTMENKGCPCGLRNCGWAKPSRDSCNKLVTATTRANTVTMSKEQLLARTSRSNIPDVLALLKFIMQT